jgi:hypothetical protein
MDGISASHGLGTLALHVGKLKGDGLGTDVYRLELRLAGYDYNHRNNYYHGNYGADHRLWKPCAFIVIIDFISHNLLPSSSIKCFYRPDRSADSAAPEPGAPAYAYA